MSLWAATGSERERSLLSHKAPKQARRIPLLVFAFFPLRAVHPLCVALCLWVSVVTGLAGALRRTLACTTKEGPPA
jgi:hypothetical protein